MIFSRAYGAIWEGRVGYFLWDGVFIFGGGVFIFGGGVFIFESGVFIF